MDIKKVYLIFKTHMDLGYTDFAHAVIEQYKNIFIPNSLRLAKDLRERGGKERFSWTIGSWMLNECLEHGSPQLIDMIKEGISQGDLHWLGVPFTTHTELVDDSLFRYGLSISQRLDVRFGRKTISAKMTDVPGHTRSVIRLYEETGIQLLHIGVNPGTKGAELPELFNWVDTEGKSILVVYNSNDYGETLELSEHGIALTVAHTSDNCGPQNIEGIIQVYNGLQTRYPKAEIIASSLNDFTREIISVKDSFPVITDEIGDTWIQGTGSAPQRIARYRALCRLRKQWEKNGIFDDSTDEQRGFSNALLKIPEHTWGLGHRFLDDDEHFTKEEIALVREQPGCKQVEASWKEQDEYIDEAISFLPEGTMKNEALAEIEKTKPVWPDFSDYSLIEPKEIIQTEEFEVQVDPERGSLCRMIQKDTQYDWCRNGHSLGEFYYEIFSQNTLENFMEDFMKNWQYNVFLTSILTVRPDFDVRGKIQDQTWYADSVETWKKEDTSGTSLIIKISMPLEPVQEYACPADVIIQWHFGMTGEAVDCTIQWFNRDACRIPDAIWFMFSPKAINNDAWNLDKMGQEVSPFHVVKNGNRRLHAIQDSIRYYYNWKDVEFIIESPDSPLVAPGQPKLYDFSGRQPAMHHGVSFNLWNNMWNTNFTLWSEEDALFHYRLKLKS